MPTNDSTIEQKQAACLKLYLKYNGRQHDQIEREMRELGWSFSRRTLHNRSDRRRSERGWIERFGWRGILVQKWLEAESAEALAVSTGSTDLVIKCSTAPSESLPTEKACDKEPPSPQPKALPEYADDPEPTVKKLTAAQQAASFIAWLKRVSPNMEWNARHHRIIADHLARITTGETKRLIINIPPRHGKSEMVTVRYAAWRLKQDPSINVVITSYGQKLASNFSRKVKGVLSDDWAIMQREKNAAAGANAEHTCLSASDRMATNGACGTKSHQSSPSGERKTPASPGNQKTNAVPCPGCENCADENPFPFVSTRLKNTEAEWETTRGGGLRAVGVGGGITGFGADLMIIDDPIKGRADAESKHQRDAVWNWFNDDIYTRLEPDGAMILIQTRWHEDDLAGRLIKRAEEENGEKWEVIDLPAIAEYGEGLGDGETGDGETGDGETGSGGDGESGSDDGCVEGTGKVFKKKVYGFPRLYSHVNDYVLTSSPPYEGGVAAASADGVVLSGGDETRSVSADRRHNGGTVVAGEGACGPAAPHLLHSLTPSLPGRLPGEALWPGRYPVVQLERTREQIGTYSFSALYQQQPVPAEGGVFKRAWFERVIAAAPQGLRWIRGYDLAATANPDSNYTASYRVAFDKDDNMYIDGGFRRRIEYPEQRRYILSRLRAERDTEHYVEGTHNGHAIVQDIQKARPARRLRAVPVREPKGARALRWMSYAEEGRLILVRSAWNQEFIEEACSFPLGTHDDQVDAVSLAVFCKGRAGSKLQVF